MKYVPPFDATDENAPYVDGSPEYGIEGSVVPAECIEHPQREIVEVIKAAGIAPSSDDLTQLLQALQELIRLRVPLATLAKPGLMYPDGHTCTVDAAGKLSTFPGMKWFSILPYDFPCLVIHGGRIYLWLAPSGPGIAGVGAKEPGEAGSAEFWLDYAASITPSRYDLCEVYYFRHPALKPGFQPAQGGVIANAATAYPAAWAYLQTTEGQALCRTEAEWQAMTAAIWHTNADGSTVGWDGIGGAPFYVRDLAAGTLRLPDLRGMYAEAAGFDSLDVGGTHGDGVRNIHGWFGQDPSFANNPLVQKFGEVMSSYGGAFGAQLGITSSLADGGGASYAAPYRFVFNSYNVAPATNKNQPRAWGALACVYLGVPTS